jgi:hypothetical protein
MFANEQVKFLQEQASIFVEKEAFPNFSCFFLSPQLSSLYLLPVYQGQSTILD